MAFKVPTNELRKKRVVKRVHIAANYSGTDICLWTVTKCFQILKFENKAPSLMTTEVLKDQTY